VKDELIYDFSENRIIIAHTINVLLLTNSGYLAFERNNVEITMIVSSDNFMWASDWFSIQYDKQGYSNTYKKKIHVESYNLMLYGCYLKSYNSVQIGESEVIIGCDYYERTSENLYQNYYRDKKIDKLLS